MNTRIKYIILFVIVYGAGIAIFAQLNEIKFGHLGVKDGISSKITRKIIQDKDGYMWFGTKRGGINRYDGYRFEIFYKDSAHPDAICGNDIRDLFVDNEGIIWIATSDGGLCVYEPSSNKIFPFHYSDDDTSSIHSHASCVMKDSKGNLWVGTVNGVYRRPANSSRFTHYTHQPSNLLSLTSNVIAKIVEDKNGVIWVATTDGGGLNYFKEEEDYFVRFYLTIEGEDYQDLVSSIDVDEKNNLWVGTKKGLYKVAYNRNEYEHFLFNPYNKKSLPNNYVTDVFVDSKKNVWIGTGAGFARYDPYHNNFINYYNDVTDNYSLSNNSIFDVYEDNNGILWISTSAGLDFYDQELNKFRHFREKLNSDISIAGSVVNDVVEDIDKKIWVACFGHGISKIDRVRQHVEQFNVNNGLSSNFVNALIKTRNGEIWMATNKGITIRDKDFTVKYLNKSKNYQVIRSDTIHTLFEDSEGCIWISMNNGISKYEPSKQLTSFFNDQVFNNIPDNYVIEFSEFYNKVIIAFFNTHIFVYDKKSGEFSPIRNKLDEIVKIPYIKDIFVDSEGVLWIGHLEGLDRYDLNTFEYTRIQEFPGLKTFAVVSIEADNTKNLWIGTRDNGLLKYNPKNNSLSIFDEREGIQSERYMERASFKSTTGELFFGGTNGLNAFFPDEIDRIYKDYPLVLTDLYVYGERMLPAAGSVLKKCLNYTDVLKLKNNQKIISIEFSLLNFRRPDKNQYAYMMEGFEKNWNYVGNIRRATYTNLPPGKYKFRVKAATDNGIWCKNEKTIDIVVEPPFWNTWWFRIIAVLTIILLIVMFFMVRIKQIKNQKINLEYTINQRTSEVLLQKDEIEKQKNIIDVKNKDITDSLKYANRIQSAILPPDSMFRELLPKSFVFLQPKGFVSGDFYWIVDTPAAVFFAVVDCTGHGVPGAFMSLIGYTLLNQAVKEHNLQHPADILNYLDHEVKENLRRADEGSRDGMDLTLCKLIKGTNTIEFAGAVNDLFLVRDKKLQIYRTDNYSVGMQDKEILSFSNHEIDLLENDIIYIFSDGYYDQYGGEDGKRFSKKRFKELLLEIHELPMIRQKRIFERELINWRGKYDQTDDILIMGVRI